jgi:hypothetical protein
MCVARPVQVAALPVNVKLACVTLEMVIVFAVGLFAVAARSLTRPVRVPCRLTSGTLST